jgi:hypothetical protein
MRTLTLDEVGFVSGGDDEPMQEVVVTGKRGWSPADIQTVLDWLNEGARHTPMVGGGSGTPRGAGWAAVIAIVAV